MASTEEPIPEAPVKIIFDTDYSTDCDDPGALAVLHALADYGEAEILATIASTSMNKTPGAIDVVNTYYGRPNIPISITKVGPAHYSFYVDHLYDNFPHDTPGAASVRDAVDAYREILANQPDNSVVIATVGYLTNIAELLKSPPDAHSPLNGHDLVALKVKEWACMGGNFFTTSSNNVNFTRDKAATYYAIRNFPKPLTFLPREVGSEPSPLRAGQGLTQTSPDNPVLIAYQKYFKRLTRLDRHCADLATVLYAVRGARDYWDLETTGSMNIQPDGTFTWDYEGEKDHNFLVMKGGYGVYSNADYVEGILRALLTHIPANGPDPSPDEPPAEDPTPVNGIIAWYAFDESPGGNPLGAPIGNLGDAGAALALTDTGGINGRDLVGNGGYQAAAWHDYGFAFDILASGDHSYHAETGGSPVGGGLTTTGPVAQSALQGSDGAFTYEALIKVNNLATEQTLLSHDGTSTRGFLFRITNGQLSFYHGAGSLTAPIPSSGTHAFSSESWFHVAVTYSGAAGVSGNLRFYWTALDALPDEANLIGTATLANDLAANNNLLGVGTTTRSPFRFELQGLIDDVRISGYARSPGDFPFLTASSEDRDGDGLADAWEIEHGMNPANHNQLGDPDNDGIVNLIEFALGLDPNVSDTASLPRPKLNDDYLTLDVPRNPHTAMLNLIPETSGNLIAWNSGSDAVVVMEDSPDRLHVRDAIAMSEASSRFIRLRVEVPTNGQR